MSRLEELARELESIHDRGDELKDVVSHARDESYDRGALTQELLDKRLGFFAHKLVTGYYDQNADAFQNHMSQLSADQQVAEMTKEALNDEQVTEPTTENPAAETAEPVDEQPIDQQPVQPEEAVQEPQVNTDPIVEGVDPNPGMTTTDTIQVDSEAVSEPVDEVTPAENVGQEEVVTDHSTPETVEHSHSFDLATFTCSCGAFNESEAPNCPTCEGRHQPFTKQHHTTAGI